MNKINPDDALTTRAPRLRAEKEAQTDIFYDKFKGLKTNEVELINVECKSVVVIGAKESKDRH